MLRKFIIFHIAIMMASVVYAQTERCDTLFTAANAESITISTDTNLNNIIVTNFNGSLDNYYYQTGVSDKKCSDVKSITVFNSVKDICIIEIGNRELQVQFVGSDSDCQLLTYTIPDPANRYVKSYIGSKRSDLGLTLMEKGKSTWSLISSGLAVGVAVPLTSSSGLNTSIWSSKEWTWNMIAGIRWSHGPHSFSSGLGIIGRNFTLDKGLYFNREDNGKISILPFDANMADTNSHINIFSLQVPVLYEIRFGRHRHFGFSAGPVINFNMNAKIKTKYTIGHRDYSVYTRNIHQRPVTMDVMGILNYRFIGVYARYMPMNILKHKTGLEFKNISFGLIFLLD